MAVINFFKGHPTNSLMPSMELLRASEHVLTETFKNPDKYHNDADNRSPLQYGTDPGNLDTRVEIAAWINRTFQLPEAMSVQAKYLNLTAGASYGMMNCLAQCTSAHNGVTRRAFIVTPTYYLINGAFIDAGFGGKLSGLLERDDGQIDLEDLVEQLEKYDAEEPVVDEVAHITDPGRVEKKIYRYVLYLIPTYSNPKGGVLSEENRLRLIEIARKYDMLVVSDDVYDLLSYGDGEKGDKPIPRLTQLDRATVPASVTDISRYHGNTISNGTFSKLICPGLRTGWQETASEALAHQLSQGGANKSGGTPSQLNISIVEDLIKTRAIDNIIENFRAEYSKRAKVITKLLRERLPAGTRVCGGDGGYFLWVTMPEGIDAREMCRQCKAQGVILASGDEFEVTGDRRGWGSSSVRLAISYLTVEEITQGIEIWSKICIEQLEKN